MKSTLPTRAFLPLCTLLTVGVLALIASAPARAGAIPSVDDPLRTGSKAPADGGVVIGIEDYVRNEIPDVPYAARDAQAFNDFLVSTRGVPTDRVRLIDSGASATKIRAAVTALGESVHAGGVAWVYFAGHGGASLDGGARMVLGDDVSNDPETFDAASVRVAELERLAGAGGGRVMIVVDACYTGVGRTGTTVLTGQRAVVPGGYTALRPADNVVWTAASAGQTSGPFEAAQHGAFTYFALGALRGWADGDIDGARDGSVTMDEAQSYVQRALRSAQITSQTPELIGARDLVLSVKAKEAAPVIDVKRPVAVATPITAPVAVPRTGDAVVDVGTDFQAQLAAAKQAAGAEAERQFVAAEATKQRVAKLDAAEASLRRQATADWASAKSLVDAGGAGAKSAADAFLAAYANAKVRVDSEERAVVVAELSAARGVASRVVAPTKDMNFTKLPRRVAEQEQAAAEEKVLAAAAAKPQAEKDAAAAKLEAEQEAAEQRIIERYRLAASLDAAAGSDYASKSLGTMKWIPAGTFRMGSPSSESGRSDDETQHSVTLTKGYWLMEHEVTQGEWQAVMGSNPSSFTACGSTCPVEQVSWDDAVAFAQKASARDGVTYALPTEAQWEYAARGGRTGELYSGSNEATSVGWMDANSSSTTHPVCGKARNGYGLCDMTGNVWEWTSDGYGDYGGSATDPTGASTGSYRVNRGGCWSRSAQYARVAFRGWSDPTNRFSNLGFRLSRTGT